MKPEFLYHYTSIESLAIILSSKKIRFNSLSNVDDIIEGQCKEYPDIGKYFFVSSWTELEEESLPFWNMYTPNMKGVRIKMPSNLFNEYPVNFINKVNLKSSGLKSIVPENDIYKEASHLIRASPEYLFKVDYTDNKENLYPSIFTYTNDGFILNTNVIGIHKSKYWTFQQEWRFILCIIPQPTKNPIDFLADAFSSVHNGDDLPFTDYFVNINETKFRQMEILLGPKHADSDRIIVESLINNYNPNIKLTISKLHHMIR